MLSPFTALVLTYTMTLQTALVRDKRITLDFHCFHCMRCMVNEEDRLWSVCHVSFYSSWMNSGGANKCIECDLCSYIYWSKVSIISYELKNLDTI